MAREVAVRGGWQVKDGKRREVGHYVLPTMSNTGEVAGVMEVVKEGQRLAPSPGLMVARPDCR